MTESKTSERHSISVGVITEADVILGGIYSSTRQAIKGPAVVEGGKLYIYPEQYEGQECVDL
ncbi:MAG TPA: hypothetical protein VEJ88_03790 [Dissulfurispiraceae bacterium]|nr:hypothetical protein [Dissulfurispiraceae bacterium]